MSASECQPLSQLLSHSVSCSHSVTQPVSQSASQPASQPVSQSVTPSLSLSVLQEKPSKHDGTEDTFDAGFRVPPPGQDVHDDGDDGKCAVVIR